MGFLKWLRNAIAGPPHIQGGGDPGADADLQEEYGVSDEGAADLRRMGGTGVVGGSRGAGISFGASEAAEAAEEDLASEEAPRDPS